jgi:7-cyano-7-deazaguanine synthase in queuosine biosynthesis
MAAAHAIGRGIPHLFYAAHSGDHAIYPDCRPSFVSAMETALHLCDWHDLTLHAPYLHLSKADIVKIGIEFDVTYFVQKTGPEPKIIMFIAHQDEQKAMEEMGLLTT